MTFLFCPYWFMYIYWQKFRGQSTCPCRQGQGGSGGKKKKEVFQWILLLLGIIFIPWLLCSVIDYLSCVSTFLISKVVAMTLFYYSIFSHLGLSSCEHSKYWLKPGAIWAPKGLYPVWITICCISDFLSIKHTQHSQMVFPPIWGRNLLWNWIVFSAFTWSVPSESMSKCRDANGSSYLSPFRRLKRPSIPQSEYF